MTIELAVLLSIISVGVGVFSAITSKRKDIAHDAEERTATNTMLMTKLDNISEDVRDIKRDYKETHKEVQMLRDRVTCVEQSLKSYHKRLDHYENEELKE